MKKSTYRQRSEDCLEAFNRVLRNSDIPVAQAFELAAALPAPRFYCTDEHARKMVAAIERGAPLPVMRDNAERMYRELHRRWKATPRDWHDRSRFASLERIIEEPAPEFYVSVETFKNLVYTAMRAQRRATRK